MAWTSRIHASHNLHKLAGPSIHVRAITAEKQNKANEVSVERLNIAGPQCVFSKDIMHRRVVLDIQRNEQGLGIESSSEARARNIENVGWLSTRI
jgi:hypothetical protein